MAIRVEVIEGDRTGTVDLARDRDLVLRYQQGDLGAFDELYLRYYDRLHGYCLRRVGDRHIAEEIAQESFLKALRAMPTFAGERRFYPWMTVIAQRLCIDHHRRNSRVEPTPEVDNGSVEADHDAVFAAVDQAHLSVALRRLAPRHREALNLREEAGWSYQQIAAHLEVPVTTVEALLHRARKALRREFLAVSQQGSGTLATMPALAGLSGLAMRLRLRFAQFTEHLAPTAATAGMAAASLLAVPLIAHGPNNEPVTTVAAPATVEALAPVTDVAAPVIATPTAPQSAAAAAATATAAKPNVTVQRVGGVEITTGPDTDQAAEEQFDKMPYVVDVLGLIQMGLNPDNLPYTLERVLGVEVAE